MKISLPYRFLLPIGLFIMSGGIMLNQLVGLPDFLHGFLVGFGITLVVAGFIITKRKMRTNK